MANTYSFLDTNFAISGPGGAFSLKGGNASEGISVEYREPKNKLTIGGDGSGMHSLRADNSGRCTIRLLKNSPTNALLSAMYNFQKISSILWGKNTISGVSSVGDVITMTEAAFVGHAKLVYDEEGESNEWQFECITLTMIAAASII